MEGESLALTLLVTAIVSHGPDDYTWTPTGIFGNSHTLVVRGGGYPTSRQYLNFV